MIYPTFEGLAETRYRDRLDGACLRRRLARRRLALRVEQPDEPALVPWAALRRLRRPARQWWTMLGMDEDGARPGERTAAHSRLGC